MRTRASLISSLLALLLAPSAKAAELTAKLNQPFFLRQGGTVVIAHGPRIEFVEVVHDSRCPPGVECVWAGMARIRLRISSAGRSRSILLSTSSGPPAASAFHYGITLLNLQPASAAAGKAKGYVARLVVRRAPKPAQ